MPHNILPGDSGDDGEGTAKQPPVPYIPGGFDPVISNRFIGPLPWPPYEEAPETAAVLTAPSRARMWLATGAIVLVSVASAGRAFYSRGSGETTPPPTAICKVTDAHEIADGTVSIRLTHPAGREKVWVGNDQGVMEAQQTLADPNVYSFNANGYLHQEIIGAYVGGTMCSGRFNLGSVRPGDETFFPAG
jgi:hypothetical protein